MPEPAASVSDDLVIPAVETVAAPHHGVRGEPRERLPALPWGLSIAISREAGSRGASIAKRAGAKLGWQVYSQDLLEFMAQESASRPDMLDPQPQPITEWVEQQIERLLKSQNLSRNPAVLDLARMILSLGAQGQVVLLGRGAGCILPPHTTLNVRLVAPEADRVAYMSQWLRLTEEEAAEQMRKLDQRRSEFIATHFHRKPSDVHQYDMVLNTSLLGEERSADLIVQAARAKMAALAPEQEA